MDDIFKIELEKLGFSYLDAPYTPLLPEWDNALIVIAIRHIERNTGLVYINNKEANMQLNFHSDPGRGWVKVKRELLKELGIEDKISSYSYQRGEYVYLEEDADLTLFVNTMKAQGRGVEFVGRSSNKLSRIRSYQSFRAEGVAA